MNFLGMGPGELLLIMILALIVFGPGKLPEIAATVGKTIRDFQRVAAEMGKEFNDSISEIKQPIDEIKQPLDQLRRFPSDTVAQIMSAATGTEAGPAADAAQPAPAQAAAVQAYSGSPTATTSYEDVAIEGICTEPTGLEDPEAEASIATASPAAAEESHLLQPVGDISLGAAEAAAAMESAPAVEASRNGSDGAETSSPLVEGAVAATPGKTQTRPRRTSRRTSTRTAPPSTSGDGAPEAASVLPSA